MLGRLLENVCYGMRPSEFLKQEITLNPVQKQIASRIFILLMLFSVVAVGTRMPSVRVTAFFLAILLPQILLTQRMALDAMKQYSVLVTISVAAGLATLILWQDQGWFRLPFAIMLIVVMMFHARKSRISNIVAIFFGMITLYNTGDPVGSLDHALWTLFIMVAAIIATTAMCAFVLWPQSSLSLLNERMRLRLDGTETLLDHLARRPPGTLPSQGMARARQSPGWTAETLKHLDDAIRDRPEFAQRKPYWIETVLELDNLDSGLTDYQRLWLDSATSAPVTTEEQVMLNAIRERLQRARAIFVTAGKVRSDSFSWVESSTDFTAIPPILHRQYLASGRLVESLDDVFHGPPVVVDPMPAEDPSATDIAWLTADYWDENKPILLWALKVAIACLIVTLMIFGMNAGEFDTAILTTVIVADSTLGADFRKSIMRITGALVGAVLGYLWLILGQPIADTIAGFLVTLAPFFYFCAWVCATSPRLNYAGLQIGLAFTMTVFSEFEPGTYLGTGWHRVLGILLGITVMGLVDYLLWPARSVDMARLRLMQTFAKIRDILRRNPKQSVLSLEISTATLRMMDANLKDAVYFLDFARLEPGSSQPEALRIVSNTGVLIQRTMTLSKIIESRHRLLLDRDTRMGATTLAALQAPLREVYADTYGDLAEALRAHQACPAPEALLREFRDVTERLSALEAFQGLSSGERAYLESVVDLEAKHVTALAAISADIIPKAEAG